MSDLIVPALLLMSFMASVFGAIYGNVGALYAATAVLVMATVAALGGF